MLHRFRPLGHYQNLHEERVNPKKVKAVRGRGTGLTVAASNVRNGSKAEELKVSITLPPYTQERTFFSVIQHGPQNVRSALHSGHCADIPGRPRGANKIKGG